MDSTTILGRIESQRPSRLTSDRILERFDKPVGDLSLAASIRREQLRRRIDALQVTAHQVENKVAIPRLQIEPSQPARTADQDLPQPPAGHREARDLATPFYQHAINRLVAAAEIQQIESKAKADAKAKKKREEELLLLWLLLMQDAAAAAYCATGNALGALLPETGMQSNTVTEAEADAFAESRAPLIRNIPENIIGKLEKSVENLPPATTPQERRKAIKEAAQDIEETYGEAVAQNEAHATYCGAQIEMLRKAGYETKQWVTMDDERVRDSHVECGEQEPIPLESRFVNGLAYPHEPDAPASESVNCRCWLVGGTRKTEKKI